MKDRSNSDWSTLLIIIWSDDGIVWRNDDTTNWSRWSFVLLWYKTRRHVCLVIQSLLLSATHQLPNKPFTSFPIMPMMNSRTFQSSSGLNTITRPSPRRSGGDYPSGQQVCQNKSGLLLMKTDLLRLRSMTWSLQTSP